MKKFIKVFSILSLLILTIIFASCGSVETVTNSDSAIVSSSVATSSTNQASSSVESSRAESSSSGEPHFIDSVKRIKIVQIEGSATVTDEEETISAYRGMNLYDGDTVTVDADSVLVLKFDTDKYVYIGENSKINIISEGKEKFKTNVFVEKGLVLAEIQNSLGVDEEFFLSSNNSVMAVRGTVFGLEVIENENEFVEIYSVYQGVTELVVFDKNGNEIINGKLSDISNAKTEIIIPKSHVISKEDFSILVSKWLKDIVNTFDDENDANNKLSQVQITVGAPSRSDYQDVVEKLGGEIEIGYSELEYSSHGYFGVYDGKPHTISVEPKTFGAEVVYRGEGETEYKETNDYEFVTPGSYRVYYKISCNGYDDKEDFEVVYITEPSVRLESDYMTYDSTAGYAKVDISSLDENCFNKYNGVLFDEIMSNANYYIGNNLIEANNVTLSYNHLIDGYIELKDGKNTINAIFEFDDYELNVDIYFLFTDTRDDLGYQAANINNDLYNLSGNLYYFNSQSFTNDGTNDIYQIDGNSLLTSFGLDVIDLTKVFINSPYNVYDLTNQDLENYNGNQTVSFNKDVFTEVNFLIYPNNLEKGYNETVYVYVSDNNPDLYPAYSIGDLEYGYNPNKANGVKMDFVDSDYGVLYSLDGTNYQEDLILVDAGVYEVYYKISYNSIEIVGKEIVTVEVGVGVIQFTNSKYITNPVHIFSNDENELTYFTIYEDMRNDYVVDTNGKIVTSIDNAYLVYSNLVKNSLIYDSITKEELNAEVTITRVSDTGADFYYSISVEGYNKVSGLVRFEYSELGQIDRDIYDAISVTLPVDYSVRLADVPVVVPGRPVLSIEDVFIDYQVYYSIDEGKTWTKDSPKIINAGTYNVYTLYCFVDQNNDATSLVDSEPGDYDVTSLASTGNFIINVQTITVE